MRFLINLPSFMKMSQRKSSQETRPNKNLPPSPNSDTEPQVPSLSPPVASSSSSSSSSTMPPTPAPSTQSQHRIDDMKLAKNRLTSFTTYNFENTNNVNLEKVAEAGFYFPVDHSVRDEFMCAFCEAKISNWSTNSCPLREHVRHSPQCPFVMGYVVGNVPLDGKLTSDPYRGENRFFIAPDVCGPSFPAVGYSHHPSGRPMPMDQSPPTPPRSMSPVPIPNPQPAPSKELASNLLRHRAPTHSKYITVESRMRTFPTNWTTICPVPARDLADAGFYHPGPLTDAINGQTLFDRVCCYQCGRNVCRWEKGDDAWEEHKKLSSSCYFIQLNYDSRKGRSGEEGSFDMSSIKKSVGQDLVSVASSFKRSNMSDHGRGHCKVCLDNEVEVAFLPCKHANSCGSCAAALDKCPFCRAPITETLRIYLS